MLFHVFIFFCFKQKTAYEMRISDWSSDVCSSDLAVAAEREAMRPEGAHRDHAAVVRALERRTRRAGEAEESLGDRGEGCPQPVVRQEIGRASCRERVCQYV